MQRAARKAMLLVFTDTHETVVQHYQHSVQPPHTCTWRPPGKNARSRCDFSSGALIFSGRTTDSQDDGCAVPVGIL
jgi:hypothetical protein